MSSPNNHGRKRSTLRQMRLVSIAGLTVSLFTLGLIALVRIGAYSLGDTIREQITLSIDLPEQMSRTEQMQLVHKIKTLPGILDLNYIDADSAARIVASKIGQTPEDMLQLLGYNPMSPMVQFHLHSEQLNPDSLPRLERALSDLGLQAQLGYRQDLLDVTETNLRHLEWILWGVLLIQFLFTFIQLNNTTRLGIYADRLKIRTLSLVGASNWFIRRPFVSRGLRDGLLGAILALALLAGLLLSLERTMSWDLSRVLPLPLLGQAALGIILVGTLSCGITALRVSGKYIRMDGNQIHVI